jgi:hypothetical protein
LIECRKNLPILRVSCADKLDNARAILGDLADPSVGERVFERFKAGKDGTRWYYSALSRLFVPMAEPAGDAGLCALARKLETAVSTMLGATTTNSERAGSK